MSTPWFFLSYSAADDEEKRYVIDFYHDLVSYVRRKAALKSYPQRPYPDRWVGFIDAVSIEVGDDWDKSIVEALGGGRTLVCLYSPTYFESENCLNELKIFCSRLAGYKNEADPKRRPNRILPVLWEDPGTLPESLPVGVGAIQNKQAALGDEYARRGLLFLKKTKRKGEYETFLDGFADRLVREAKAGHLPPLEVASSLVKPAADAPTTPQPADAAAQQQPADAANVAAENCEVGPDFSQVAEYLAGDVSETPAETPAEATIKTLAETSTETHDAADKDTREGPKEEEDKPRPYLLYALVAAAVAVVAVLVWRYAPTPITSGDSNANASTTTRPAARRESWSDDFTNSGTADAPRWAQAGLWDVNGQKPFWKPNFTNGSLDVQGEGAAVVSGFEFDDFEVVFPVKFKDGGTKAGWVFRAQGEKQSDYTGYCFVLERAAGAFQLFGYWGKPRQRPDSLAPQRIPITQFGADSPADVKNTADYILVKAKAEGNTFLFVFQLMNPHDSEDDPRHVDLGVCFTVTAKAEPLHATQGRVGFFAEGGDQFHVDTLSVYPMPQLQPHAVCDKSGPQFTIK